MERGYIMVVHGSKSQMENTLRRYYDRVGSLGEEEDYDAFRKNVVVKLKSEGSMK